MRRREFGAQALKLFWSLGIDLPFWAYFLHFFA